ncbi:uncharacterized protein LOC124545929 [Schistocerca americana]|uniref:uncharacterized protein LOC124545929 n=1 Tax=Schistocerca americana TaxID=7009 RepID=UPI001F4F3C77|nr:uncharacterized protein LOC124545929 [Schistocerca americana]
MTLCKQSGFASGGGEAKAGERRKSIVQGPGVPGDAATDRQASKGTPTGASQCVPALYGTAAPPGGSGEGRPVASVGAAAPSRAPQETGGSFHRRRPRPVGASALTIMPFRETREGNRPSMELSGAEIARHPGHSPVPGFDPRGGQNAGHAPHAAHIACHAA